jgi:hypothetical protein
MTQISDTEDILGYIVIYGATSTRDATYEEAKAAIERHGLITDELKEPTPFRAYSRAMQARETKDLRARNAVNDPARSVTLLIREHHEIGTESFEYAPEDRAEFDKKARRLVVRGQQKDAIETDFAHYSASVIGDDIRHMTKRAIEKLDGVSLRGSVDVRDAGGVYFVPVQHREQLQALINVLEDLHIGYLRAYGVVRGSSEELQVAMSAEAYVEKQVGDVVHAIKDVKARVSAVEKHKAELSRLQQILKNYAEMSGRATPSPLLRKIADAHAIADAKIASLTPKKPRSKKPRPAA